MASTATFRDAPASVRRSLRAAHALPLLLACVLGVSSAPAQAQAPGTGAEPRAVSSPVPEVRTARAKPIAVGEALRLPARTEPIEEARLRLPARTEPIEEARLYARTSGTLAERRVGLGDQVAAGAVLARIAAPEVDQAVGSARASLQQAKARERLAQLTLERNRPLVEQNFVSSSRLDDLAAALDVARADTAAAEAELRRYEALQGFQTVRAPFAGTVTDRLVERGDRVSADGANNSPALFRLARLDRLRVVVDVPQAAVAGLKPGQTGRVTFQEFPGEAFEARIERVSGQIDASSGSMRIELNLPNPQQRVPAGLRGEVALSAPAGALGFSVPANAVQLVGGRPHVATVDADSKLRFVPVQVGRTVGREVEVSRGLTAGAVVVLNVNSMLQEGQTVKAAAPPAASPL